MAAITVKFSQASFIKAMRDLSVETGAQFQDLLRYQMALWCIDLVRKTAADPGKSLSKQRAQGEARVEKDIRHVVKGVAPQEMKVFSDDWEIFNKGQPIGHLFKSYHTGAVYGVDYDMLDASGATIPTHHAKARSPITGRVTTAGAGGNSGTKAIGRWKFVNILHAPEAKVVEHIKKKQAHVGKTKAGWLRAAYYFCSKTRGLVDIDKMPDWVLRHTGVAGSYTDNFKSAATIIGDISSSNNVPWVRDDVGFMNSTLRTRLLDLQSGMWKRMEIVAGILQKKVSAK